MNSNRRDTRKAPADPLPTRGCKESRLRPMRSQRGRPYESTLGWRMPLSLAIEIVPDDIRCDELDIAAQAISFVAIIKGIALVATAILRERVARKTGVTTKEFCDDLLSAALSLSLGTEAQRC